MTASNSLLYSKSDNKLTINYLLLLGLSLLILIHLLSLYSTAFAIVIAVIENILVYYYLLSGKNKTALIYMCLFYATCYSNPVFFGTARNLDTIYCIEVLPLVHGYLMLLSFFILFINLYSKTKKILNVPNTLSKFAQYTVYAGIIMGFATILINGFQSRAIISDINQCVIPALMILVFVYYFEEDSLYAKKYLSLVFHIFLSYIIIAWVTVSLNIFADFVRVRDKVLMVPLPSFYFSCILLFLGQLSKFKEKIVVIVAFLSTVIFQLFFDSCMNGKSWIVFTTTIIVGLYYLAANSIKRNFVLYGAILVILGFFIIRLVPMVDSFISDTKNTKLLEFVSLFAAADSGEIDDMGSSSQFRFLEFINVTEQYIEQPYFALTGRGYGGSIHSNGYFWDRSESGFSEDQYNSDKFYTLHESMNVIFLKFGLIGLLLFILILFKLLRGIKYSPWCYVGLIWLFFFWGYQNSLLFVGLPAMVFGILYTNQNKASITKV